MRPRKLPEKKESATEARCRELASSFGFLLKWVSPGNAGVPDRILILPNKVAFIEFKRPGQKLEPLQLVWKERLEKLGFQHYTVDSVEQFQRVMCLYL